jgi:hypothetical protein
MSKKPNNPKSTKKYDPNCTLDHDGKEFTFKKLGTNEDADEHSATSVSQYGFKIKKRAADKMIRQWAKTNPSRHNVAFSAKAFRTLLKVKGAAGIRLHFGLRNDTNDPKSPNFLSVILKPIDAKGKEIAMPPEKGSSRANPVVGIDVGQ